MKFLNANEQKKLIEIITNKKKSKHLLITLLQLDCGLRVSEALSLTIENFNFAKKTIKCKVLKSKKERWKEIPLSTRLLDATINHLNTLKSQSPTSYIFPSPTIHNQHINARTYWLYLRRIGMKNSFEKLHPHMLRHSCATRMVAAGAHPVVIKNFLGHDSISSTDIYMHTDIAQLRQAVAALEPRNFLTPLKKYFIPKKETPIRWKQTKSENLKSSLIGRKKELDILHVNIEKKQNTIITGQQGIGKSELLKNISHPKILRLEEINKKSITELCIYLLENDKKNFSAKIFTDSNFKQRITKYSSKQLCELLTGSNFNGVMVAGICQQYEYLLILDDVSNLSKIGVQILEFLNNHFVIACAARELAITKTSFLHNFEKIQIKPLTKNETSLLLKNLSFDFLSNVKNYELFDSTCWRSSGGVPLFVFDFVKKMKGEEEINDYTLNKINLSDKFQPIDLSWSLLVLFALLVVFRYVGRAHDDSTMIFIGSVAFVCVLFFRQVISKTQSTNYS